MPPLGLGGCETNTVRSGVEESTPLMSAIPIEEEEKSVVGHGIIAAQAEPEVQEESGSSGVPAASGAVRYEEEKEPPKLERV